MRLQTVKDGRSCHFPNSQKFFGSFFQKKTASLKLLSQQAALPPKPRRNHADTSGQPDLRQHRIAPGPERRGPRCPRSPTQPARDCGRTGNAEQRHQCQRSGGRAKQRHVGGRCRQGVERWRRQGQQDDEPRQDHDARECSCRARPPGRSPRPTLRQARSPTPLTEPSRAGWRPSAQWSRRQPAGLGVSPCVCGRRPG